MTTTLKHEHLVQSVADALQFISYYHPADYMSADSRNVMWMPTCARMVFSS